MNADQPAVALEDELKLRVHGLFRLPTLDDDGIRAEPLGTTSLVAVYLDSADLRLAREGVTLRRREGGKDAGWHLKLPKSSAGPGLRRHEISLPLSAGPASRPPAELLALVRAVLRDDPVAPVATLHTERTTYALRTADGPGISAAELGELVDDTVSVYEGDASGRPLSGRTATGRRAAARFRELELEVADGTDAGARTALQPLVGRLLQAGAATGDEVPKLVRALGPAARRPAEVPPPAEVAPDDPARHAVIALLAKHTRALRAADIAVRQDADDSVHQLRVACRKLRSGLRTFRPLLDREWADRLRGELSWLAGVAGPYRDAEVLLARFERDADGLPADQPAAKVRGLVRRRLRRQMAEARVHTLEALDSPRYLTLHADLVQAVAAPAFTEAADEPCRTVLPRMVRKAWKSFDKAARQVLEDEEAAAGSSGGLTGAPDEEWHDTRKAAKKVRYAADLCAPVLGDGAEDLAKQLSQVTDVLGDHQDGVVAAEAVAQMARTGRVNGQLGFALGLLHEAERAGVVTHRAAFRPVWRETRRKQYTKWMR